MAIKNPKPKTSDGAIIFVTVCLMGAPEVLGPHISHTLGQFMFWGGLTGLLLFLGGRWGVWLWRQVTGALSPSEPFGGNNRSVAIGRDNFGSIHNHANTIITTNLNGEGEGVNTLNIPLKKFRDIAGAKLHFDIASTTQWGQFLLGLKQAAEDGDVVLWGERANVRVRIPLDHWRHGTIDAASFLSTETGVTPCSYGPSGFFTDDNRKPAFTDLQIDRVKALAWLNSFRPI